VNANILVNLLLELNVVNMKDIDNEINKLAARVTDPRAQKWFRRVPRFFLINIDRLLAEPYAVKAEPRGPTASKYYAHPKGGWRKDQTPAQSGAGMPVREEYDPEKRTYSTMLHAPAVERDIEQSFTPFKPTKAKAKRLFGEPPTKTELQPWMTAPGAETKKFHHFDPIQTRRRELFIRLGEVANYLNWQSNLLTKIKSADDMERNNAQEADNLMRRLETMKTDDTQGFRDVLKQAGNFASDVAERPWLLTKDGQIIAQHGNLTMRKVIYAKTASLFSMRGQPVKTSSGAATDGNGNMPAWCTKSERTAEGYLNNGPLYFVDKNDRPYVLAHFPSHQVYNVLDQPLADAVVKEIAPLFADANRFPYDDLYSGSEALANEVRRIRQLQQ